MKAELENGLADQDSAPTTELIRTALAEVQELARAEVALASKELGAEARDAVLTTVATAVSIAIGIAALAATVAALIVAFGGTVLAAFASAAAILAIATALGVVASVARRPKAILPESRRRVSEGISEMRDHFA